MRDMRRVPGETVADDALAAVELADLVFDKGFNHPLPEGEQADFTVREDAH